ncbi:MAG: hypothetical protein IRY99_10730 [Isosphaeraceae bacterium]|nr:hypothetical protein [Isosphaeraceae bacterium]
MRFHCVLVLAVVLSPLVASAQEGPFKVEPLKEAPPAGLGAPVKEALGGGQAYRVLDGQGKPFLEIWLRKEIPATDKPAGPKGAILFPVLSEGELLGAVRYVAEGHDYRDQAIAPGVYTLRYGLQPVNGDHLGVSENRDYGLLLPAAKDSTVEDLPQKRLETQSAEAAGTNHPAVLLLQAAPAEAKEPVMVNDEVKMTWGLVLPLSLAVKGQSGSVPLTVQLIIFGAAMM